jgi:predicted  nucleic acid-binding Zn-ribbon protein
MLELMLKWAPLLLSVVNLAFYAVLWVVGKTLVSKRELDEVRTRVAHLEEVAESAPGWNALNDLKGRIAALDGDLKRLDAKIEGLRDLLANLQGTLDMVQQHLLEAEVR